MGARKRALVAGERKAALRFRFRSGKACRWAAERRSEFHRKAEFGEQSRCCPAVPIDKAQAVHAGGGSGAVIRRAVIRDYFNAAGSRRKIGLLAKASFSGWNRVEHYEPEGSRGPEGEWKPEDNGRVHESDLATGLAC
jgi:hypothetical protein